MPYVVPSLLISQEFSQLPVLTESPLSALVMGPFLPPPGYISAIALGTAGAGYTSAPGVVITDTTGTGATAYTTISTAGAVTGYVMTSGGIGYSSSPTITVDAPPNTATAYATLDSTNKLANVVVINHGANYGVSAPAVTFSTPDSGTGHSATAVLVGGVVDHVTVVTGTSVWSVTPITVSIAPPQTVTETQAVAGSATVESTNTLTSRTIHQVPAGYTASTYIPFIGVVNSVDDIVKAFGDIAYANTIAYGCLQALNNSNGAPVYYGVVQPLTISGMSEELAYANVMTAAAKSNAYYGLVPLTFNKAVQNDLASHVNAMSSPQQAKWRTAWFCSPLNGTATLSTATGSNAEITTYLSAISASGAHGISSSNPNSGLRRVHNVFPQTYTDGNNTTVEGYFLAAALAGLRSGSAPHQSLTNTQVIGPVSVPISTITYSNPALDTLAGAGVWIVTQNSVGGVCYTRHQLTGDNANLNYREDSVTANVDSISYGLQSDLAPFVGIYNISPGVLLQIRSVIDSSLNYYLTGTYTARAGNQLISYKIVSIKQDATFQDRLDVTIQLQVPYPLNFLVVTLSI